LIDHRLVDRVLDEQGSLMGQVHIVPEQENGRTVGIRLLNIPPGTLLALLGFRNGDRLERINDFDLATPEQTLAAYARLRSADYLEVRLTRNGSKITMRYEFW
jgi:general secretion pathway protein C